MKGTNETKLCKHCQTEIPKKAKVCPNCRKKQGGKLKWIIIAIVVIGIIGAAMGGGDDEEKKDNTKTENVDTAKNDDSNKNEGKEDSEDNTLTVGSSFEKGGLKITVNDANVDFQDYSDEYGFNTPAEGMKYVMASFTFENGGDTDAYVSIYDFACYADNTSCEQVYSLDDSNFINENLSPGRNVSFKTYYSVPVGAQSIELEYETSFWKNEKAIIKLQ